MSEHHDHHHSHDIGDNKTLLFIILAMFMVLFGGAIIHALLLALAICGGIMFGGVGLFLTYRATHHPKSEARIIYQERGPRPMSPTHPIIGELINRYQHPSDRMY